MSRFAGKLFSPLTLVLLTNCLPLFFVVFAGWSLVGVVTLFWVESIVLGVFAIPRMLLAQPIQPSNALLHSIIHSSGKAAAKPFVALVMFPVFYFGLCYISGLLLAVFAQARGEIGHAPIVMDPLAAIERLLPAWWGVVIVAVVVRHAESFIREYVVQQKYKTATFIGEVSRPIMWSIFLYMAIACGGGIALVTHGFWLLAILMIVGKTCIEVAFVPKHPNRTEVK